MSKSQLRQRITPSVPYALEVENPDGSSFTESFELAYDMNAFTAFEQATGISVLTDMARVMDEPSITTTTALFWAAILQNHPEYTGFVGLRAIRNLITLDKLPDIHEKCVEAFITQLPKSKADAFRARLDAAKKGEQLPEPPLANPPTATDNQ